MIAVHVFAYNNIVTQLEITKLDPHLNCVSRVNIESWRFHFLSVR